MKKNSHADRPEIWLRPSPGISFKVLSMFIDIRTMTATPRLGARNGAHTKGYKPGQVVLLRLFDEKNVERLQRTVRIEDVTIRPLRELTPDDLHDTVLYHNWREVRRELSFFEKRPIEEREDASVIGFSYL
jgi:hypothetical protein